MLTEHGWRAAGDLVRGDRLARPRAYSEFGSYQPVPPDHARLLGYLIGDGYVSGKTPVQFTKVVESLHQDAARIVGTLGCVAKQAGRLTAAFSPRPGEKNGVVELCRWAGVSGDLARVEKLPAAFFAPDVSAEVIGHLIFGLFESDGHVSREQTGGIRIGFSTTSEQLAYQLHWLLLRWGIGSSVQRRARAQHGGLINGRRISGKRPSWEVRVSGVDNVSAFAAAIPMWGPRGQVITHNIAGRDGRYRGSQRIYLSDEMIQPILAHLDRIGATPSWRPSWSVRARETRGEAWRWCWVPARLRRDRVQRLADGLDDPSLEDILADQLWFSRVAEILPARRCRTFDVEVADLHNLVAEDVIVHNCAPSFQNRRVRHHFRDRDQPRGRADRPRGRAVHRPQVGSLVHLRGRSARPGQGELPQLPPGQPGPRERDREENQGEARRRAAHRRGSRSGRRPTDRRHGDDAAVPPRRVPGGAPVGGRRQAGRLRAGPRARANWRGRRCLTGRRPGVRGARPVRAGTAGRPAPGTADAGRAPGPEAAAAKRPARPGEPAATPSHPPPPQQARQLCLRLLTGRPRTRVQLAEAMSRRGIPDDAAAAVLARFTEVGLIDDAAFARAWVESRHHGRGLARRALWPSWSSAVWMARTSARPWAPLIPPTRSPPPGGWWRKASPPPG